MENLNTVMSLNLEIFHLLVVLFVATMVHWI